MAAAARLNPADARVPCPLCGNLIHPIAGRCKYCKGDLQTGRPQGSAASAALPALVAVPVTQQPYAPQPAYAPQAYAPSGPAPVGTPPAGVVLPPSRESQQVLPPRPTGRMKAAKGPSIWRSWPMIVIAVASLAIVAAVVIMVWPDSADTAKQNALEPPPAPIRMETDRDRPLPPSATPGGPQGANPPSGGSDPWSSRGTTPPTAPDPDDIDTIDPPTAPDPYAAAPDPSQQLLEKMAKDLACSTAKSLRDNAVASCPGATSCFDKFSSMACSANGADLMKDPTKLQSLLTDCMQAANC